MRRFPFLPLCLSSFALSIALCLPSAMRADESPAAPASSLAARA